MVTDNLPFAFPADSLVLDVVFVTTTACMAEVTLEIAAKLPDDDQLEGNAFQEEPVEPPRRIYSYRFPFEDGRRVEAPTGSVVENVRAVYKEISGAILVGAV